MEWEADVVVELTLYAETCLDQPNRRPKVGVAPLLMGSLSAAWLYLTRWESVCHRGLTPLLLQAARMLPELEALQVPIPSA